VQTDLIAGRNVSSTSLDSMVFTLDPRDKYLPPGVRRASTTSAVQKRKARHIPAPKIIHRSASTPLDSVTPPQTSTSSRDGQSTLDRQSSIMSVFHRIRQTRSAGSNTKSSLVWPRKLFSRTGQSAKVEAAEEIPEVPKIPRHLLEKPKVSNDRDLDLSIQRPSTARGSVVASTKPMNAAVGSVLVPWPQEDTPIGDYQPARPFVQDTSQESNPRSSSEDTNNSCTVDFVTQLEQLNINDLYPPPAVTATGNIQPSESPDRAHRLRNARAHSNLRIDLDQPAKRQDVHKAGHEPQNPEEQQQAEHNFYATTYTYAESSRFSYATSENFSPGFASNATHSGPMSPLHLSQPETPIMSDFEDDYDPDFLQMRRDSELSGQFGIDLPINPELTAPEPPSRAPPPPPPPPPKANSLTSHATFGGFQGYSLPSDDNASVLTLRKLPSMTLRNSNQGSPFTPQAGKQEFVQSWNDGSEHLLDDLGYLGELIE